LSGSIHLNSGCTLPGYDAGLQAGPYTPSSRQRSNLSRQFHFIASCRAGSDRLLHVLTYLRDAAAPYTFTGLVDIDEAQHDHERMMDLFEARDVDGVIEMMTRHRGLAVEPVARWEARSRP
jgi:DNA-binding GntR family transcriptional regulator